MDQYTPGPWRIDQRAQARIVARQNDTVASVACQSDLQDSWLANARLIAAAPQMLEALLLLTGNPQIDLGDLIYHVREREGGGWDGPAVLAWNAAVTSAKAAIEKATKP